MYPRHPLPVTLHLFVIATVAGTFAIALVAPHMATTYFNAFCPPDPTGTNGCYPDPMTYTPAHVSTAGAWFYNHPGIPMLMLGLSFSVLCILVSADIYLIGRYQRKPRLQLWGLNAGVTLVWCAYLAFLFVLTQPPLVNHAQPALWNYCVTALTLLLAAGTAWTLRQSIHSARGQHERLGLIGTVILLLVLAVLSVTLIALAFTHAFPWNIA